MNLVDQSQPGTNHGSDVTASQFDTLAAQAERTIARSSARVYRHTFALWREWCAEHGVAPFDLSPNHVKGFLSSKPTTKTTRQRQLSALRKLAQLAHLLNPNEDTRHRVQSLRAMKVPSGDGAEQKRAGRALSPQEANRLLHVWDGDSLRAMRNRAIVGVLLLGGLRRSEAAGLRWSDIDFDNGVMHIRRGTKDKEREVPVAGDYALDALKAWQLAQGRDRDVVFCAIKKGGQFGADKPLRDNEIYRIWDATARQAGIESKPNDARRTFITEALATGTPAPTVQAIVGHSRGDTTLRYAQAVDAQRAREELKLRYG